MEAKMTKVDPGYVHDYKREISGRCHNCNVRFIWPRRLGKLSEKKCPQCGSRLRQTTHLFKGTTYQIQ